MKKIIIAAALCAFVTAGSSQNSYGEMVYPHPASYLTSGTITTINPGFLMAGCSFTNPVGSPNFYIDQTDVGGIFSGSPWEFQQQYLMFGQPSCPANPSQIQTCAGVSLIESNFITSRPYIMTGAMDYGCFFATYSGGGAVSTQVAYSFPGSSPKQFYTKPLICESVLSPGAYYIVGAYDNTMYLLKVNSWGNIMWQNSFQISTSVTLSPRAIIESPYGNNEVTVVGASFNMPTTVTDGFFFQIDTTLTTVSVFNTYDVPATANNNGFTSMQVAQSSSAGGNGFLIGGYAEVNNFAGKAWMLKLDPTGSTAYWSTFISGTTDIISGKIHAVIERFSSVNSIFENYGACAANTGFTVYKLDDFGIPFNLGYATNDEFVYNNGGANNTWPINMTFINPTSPNDEGMHLYGNMNVTGGAEHYFAEAYFNGEAGCNISTTISTYTQFAPSINSSSYNTTTGLSVCGGFYINSGTTSAYTALCGPFASIGSGSNNKPLAVNELKKSETDIAISPNPTNNYITIIIDAAKKSELKLTITNTIGQVVKSINHKGSSQTGKQSIEISLQELGLERGIYFISTETNGVVNKEKIIYTH